MRFNPLSRSRRGFTLVELLVVITIVLVLAALVFLMAGRARDAAYNSGCVSSLRQLATAGQIYAAEHGAYPNHGRQADGSIAYWFKAMTVELGFEAGSKAGDIERAETMPTCKKCLREYSPGTNPSNKHIRTYSMNQDLLSPGSNNQGQSIFPGLRTSQVVSPSSTAFFMDGILVGGGPYWDYLISINRWLKPENFIHNGRANVVFLDGHVQALRIAEVPTNRQHSFWNPQATERNPP